MRALLEGLVQDFVEAAQDPSVPAHELGVLAQELDVAVGAQGSSAPDAIALLGPLFEAEGPALYIGAILAGGWVERGAAPHHARALVQRLQGWLTAAERGEPEAGQTLNEVWRALVAIIGAWPEARRSLKGEASRLARAVAEHHPAGIWLARLIDAPDALPLRIVVPDQDRSLYCNVTGVGDILQLSVLVNAALTELPEEAVQCARGQGAQTRAMTLRLPRVLTELDGEILPEGAELSALPQHEGRALVVAMLNPEPFVRPVGRVFSTLKAELSGLGPEPA